MLLSTQQSTAAYRRDIRGMGDGDLQRLFQKNEQNETLLLQIRYDRNAPGND